MTTITITFTDGKFEKQLEAANYEEALLIANDEMNYPIEISDYSKMKIIINDNGFENIIKYK